MGESLDGSIPEAQREKSSFLCSRLPKKPMLTPLLPLLGWLDPLVGSTSEFTNSSLAGEFLIHGTDWKSRKRRIRGRYGLGSNFHPESDCFPLRSLVAFRFHDSPSRAKLFQSGLGRVATGLGQKNTSMLEQPLLQVSFGERVRMGLDAVW